METSSPKTEAANTEDLSILDSQIRELFGRTAYSHKTHEKCADIYLGRLGNLKIAQIVLSAVTTGTLIVSLLGEGKAATVVAAILAAILLMLTSYSKDYDLGALAQKHSEIASDLWNVRESYLSLLTDIASNVMSSDEIRVRRDELQNTLKAVYDHAPRTNDKAYKLAQKALKINEDLTFSDAEINVFLPKALHKTSVKALPKPVDR